VCAADDLILACYSTHWPSRIEEISLSLSDNKRSRKYIAASTLLDGIEIEILSEG
jgi:hypothetical protein